MNYPIGTTMTRAEMEPCNCHGGPTHWHAYEAIWTGEKWLRFADVWPLMEFCYNSDVSKVHHETLAKQREPGSPVMTSSPE